MQPASHTFDDAAQTWNRRFAPETYLFGTEPNSYPRRQAFRWERGNRILCVAGGERRNSVWLARQGLQVDALDIAEAGVRKARHLARQAKVAVHFSVADGARLAWPANLYDGIAAIFVQFGLMARR